MNFRKHLPLSLLVAGLTLSGTAIAHGNQAGHSEKKPAVAVEKEQTDWGIAGDASDAKRTIQVAMLDKMRFDPESVKVEAGETVRFVIENKGQIMHEFVLGNQQSLDDHAALMIKFPNMEHDAPYQAHVSPGTTGEIVWKFNRGGELKFACLIPGHYQAGMIGKLNIAGDTGNHTSVKKESGHGHTKDDHGDEKKKKHTH
ncbi:MAG: cupredoxin family protein [Burkholderiaceae bacterium]